MIRIDSAGIQLTVEPATVSMSPEEGIAITFPPNEVSLTDAGMSTNTTEAFTVEAGVDVAITAPATEEPSAGSCGPA